MTEANGDGVGSELPARWEQIPLESVAGEDGLFADGDWILSDDLKSGDDVRLLQLGDIGTGTFLDKSSKWISKARFDDLGCTEVLPGDLLISRMAEPIARACRVPHLRVPLITAVDVTICRVANPDFDPEFVLHALNSDAIRAQAEREASGTTRKRITRKKLGRLLIPKPRLDEQRRIVERLEERLGAIDDGARSLTAADSRGHALRLATLESSLDPSWPRRPLEETILSLKNGIFVSRPAAEPPGIPIFRISAVRPMQLRTEDIRYAPADTDKAEGNFVRAGDLLFTRYSGNPDFVGACALVPELPDRVLHPDKLIRVVVDPEILDPSFAELACSAGQTLSEIRARRKTTSGQVGISGKDLRRVTLPVPPLEAQRDAVAQARAALDAVEKLAGDLRQVRTHAERLRRSVLVDAFEVPA